MPNIEGESHRRQRRLMNAAFTQRSVDVLRPFMRAKAHELIDGFVGQGSCEFMTAFAKPYPCWVIAELLGVPAEQFDALFGWITDIAALGLRPAAVTEQERVDVAIAGLLACCDELIALRREHPANDLVSTLIAAEPDAYPLDADELRLLTSSILFGGQESTRAQLGLAMMTFTHHLDQWRLLAKRPELASTAVEELMRVNPAISGLGRVAIENFTFHGIDIAAGTHLTLFIAAANADSDIFGEAPFDITAQRKEQLTFGSGIHSCLGARLARTEIREALPILASRLDDIALAEPGPVPTSFGPTRPTTLPLKFRKID
jgi:cytochrome P450